MKNSLTPFYLFVFTCLFLVLGCEDDDMIVPIVEEEEPVLAELSGLSDFDRRAFGIQLYGGNMLIQTENTDLRFLEDGSMESRFSLGSRRLADATSSTLHAKVTDDVVRIEFVGVSPFSNGPRFQYAVAQLGEDARLYPEQVSTPNRMASLSEDDYLLLPFRREGDNRLWLNIMEITYTGAPSSINVPELASVQTIVLPTSDSAPNNQIIHQDMLPVPGGFLVTLSTVNDGSPTYRINYDGSFERVFDSGLAQMFHYGEELFAVRHNTPDLDIMTADTDGRNWERAYVIPNPANQFFRFFPVEDDLFVRNRNSGILFVVTELTPDNIRMEAIDTPILDSRTITDMANYLGDTYITTLSGTFIGETERLRSSRRE